METLTGSTTEAEIRDILDRADAEFKRKVVPPKPMVYQGDAASPDVV